MFVDEDKHEAANFKHFSVKTANIFYCFRIHDQIMAASTAHKYINETISCKYFCGCLFYRKIPFEFNMKICWGVG